MEGPKLKVRPRLDWLYVIANISKDRKVRNLNVGHIYSLV